MFVLLRWRDKLEFDIEPLEAITDMPKFFIADAKTLLASKEARILLYNKCIENNRKIIVIGDGDSLDILYDVTATDVIIESFERPVEYEDVVDHTIKHIQEFDARGRKKNILVVDDSPIFLRLVSGWLEKDYNVSICPSATVAFQMIYSNKPDLILLDYEMPVCNGVQFLQMLRSEQSTEDIPVIFLTSKDDYDIVSSVIAQKPQGYLLKTQTMEHTLQTIADFFEQDIEKKYGV